MSLKRAILLSVSAFTMLSIYVIIQHERNAVLHTAAPDNVHVYLRKSKEQGGSSVWDGFEVVKREVADKSLKYFKDLQNLTHRLDLHTAPIEKPTQTSLTSTDQQYTPNNVPSSPKVDLHKTSTVPTFPPAKPTITVPSAVLTTKVVGTVPPNDHGERLGSLTCNGQQIDSEVIYWKVVPGDNEYESPITPHHGLHHDRYITYEYDEGGWNNIRMGMECHIVMAHAMGRTLVVPAQQHLYLLGRTHVDEEGKKRDEMGFEDFFDVDLLRGHKGFHVLSTKEFLLKEACTGGLKGKIPPRNDSNIWGQELNQYLRQVADQKPEWTGKFLAMPNHTDSLAHFDAEHFDSLPAEVKTRLKAFGGQRTPVFYGKELQEAHHIHFQSGPKHRLLQHHYAFTFFMDKEMQSFYRRFVRDYMRYKDDIQCAAHAVVQAVRRDALAHNKGVSADYYSIHVRRGDFQFKEVKLGAADIVRNLIVNGKSVIPSGALVYLSTDDPEGVCKGCMVQRIPCENYEKGSKPPGCPEDPSWRAFADAGWTIKFLDDYIKEDILHGVNPNVYGIVESIVCSRSKVFAGTFFSTFSGYIHRLRGYHGLGEETYYHSNGRVTAPRMEKSVGHGFSREWRAGWTDDAGELI